MVRAVIFDMDGVLIDSEALWRQALVEVFAGAGIPYTEMDAIRTQGMRTVDIVEKVLAEYPAAVRTAEELDEAIGERVSELVLATGRVMDGIGHVLDFVERNGLPLGLATSTPRKVALRFIERIGIGKRLDVICTGDEVRYGKPHPEIYILCADRLGVAPEDCLVFEDSVNGVLAAKAARCRCIAVPDPDLFDDRRYGIADYKIRSLSDFDGKTAL